MDLNPLLLQFIEQTNLKDVLEMDVNEIKRIRNENKQLEGHSFSIANLKKLAVEFQNEKNKTSLLQNEINNLNGCMAEERTRYQNELLKISAQIKKLRNIQNLYVNEKRTSERLENQLNLKDQKLQELNQFVKEVIDTSVGVLRNLVMKQEIRKDFHLSESISGREHESVLKIVQEMRRILLSKLENAEKLKFDYDWGSAEHRELLMSTRQQLKNFRERKASQQSSSESNLAGVLQKGGYAKIAREKKGGLAKSHSDLVIKAPINQSPKPKANTNNVAIVSGSKRSADLSRMKEANLVGPGGADEQLFNALNEAEDEDHLPLQERLSLIELGEEIKMAQDEMLLSDRRVEYSFDQGYRNDQEKEFPCILLNNHSQENIQNLEANYTLFGRSEQNFNYHNCGGIENNFAEGSPLQDKGAKPHQVLFERQKINMITSGKKGHIETASNENSYQKNYRMQNATNSQNVNFSANQTTNRVAQDVQEDTSEQNYKKANKKKSAGFKDTSYDFEETSHSTFNAKKPVIQTSNRELLTRVISNQKPNEYETQNSESSSRGLNLESAVAKFDYDAQRENDLSFSKGDQIQVLKRTKSGWWIGACCGKIGYFPCNFVQIFPENPNCL